MPLILGEDGVEAVRPAPYIALRETASLLGREIEDLWWQNVGRDPTSRLDITYDERWRLIDRCRWVSRTNPLAKTAVGLLQHYVLGQGISIKAQNRPVVAKVVDEFLNDSRNRAVLTTHESQKEFLAAAWEDGDAFIVVFPDIEAGTVQLGWLDAAMVADLIPDPGNAKIMKWVKARKPNLTYDFATDTWNSNAGPTDWVYYRYWQNDDPAPASIRGKLQPGIVYQTSIDRRGKFGRPQMATALPWLDAHAKFMQNRAAINEAATAVAWKKKRMAGPGEVAREVKNVQSGLVSNQTRYDNNPPRAAASTVVENMGSTLQWVDSNTGGAAADFDERKLRMMSGSGMGGIPNHYFGDEAQANLATATAMELPLLKMYEDYQQTMGTVLTDLIDFALAVAHEAGRIGPRDDSNRYAERVTTPQAVMDAPDVQAAAGKGDNSASAPRADTTSRADTTVVKTVITREMRAVIMRECMGWTEERIREAEAIPYSPAPMGGLRLIPNPNPPEEVSTDPGTFESEPVSWYVDIDFAPIIQKQIDLWMNSVKVLSDLLPSSNIESQKLVTELALTGFGVNDLDEQMVRLYPPDMVAVQMPAAPPPPQFGGQPGPPQPPPNPVSESRAVSLAEYRARQIVRLADETARAVIGG